MNPQDYWITFPELLIWFPLVAGLFVFFIRTEKMVKIWSLLASLIILSISIISLFYANNTQHFYLNNVSYFWLKYLGSNFTVGLDGMGHLLTALTAVAFPIIFIATYKINYKNANVFRYYGPKNYGFSVRCVKD